MPSYRFAVLDVFTATRFEGNQLALVHVPRGDTAMTQVRKHAVTHEFGFSETVFLHEGEREGQKGHPTIGTVCYLAQEEHATSPIALSVLAGPIVSTYSKDTARGSAFIPHAVHQHSHKITAVEILMGQAALATLHRKSTHPNGEPKVEGLAPLAWAFDVVSIVKGMTFIMAEMPNLEYLGVLQKTAMIPEVKYDAGWEQPGFAGQMFFVSKGRDDGGKGKWRLRTRMMSARMVEDAATGSASAGLACYLALRETNGEEEGKEASKEREWEFEMEQGVEMGRRSLIEVKVKVSEDGKEVDKVELSGGAVVVMRGELEV